MKSLTKRIGVFAVVVAILASVVAGTGLVFSGLKVADAAQANYSNKYFYNQISSDSRAEKFYKAFETLELDSLAFRDGKVEYDLVKNGVVSEEDVAEYVNNGDSKIPVAYAKGRDAYYLDHPDLFYVDLFSTSISAGQQGQNYVAFLDTSRATTLYKGNIDSREEVNQAIQTYENKLTEIVNGAKAAGDVVEQIKYVNKYIVDHTIYTFGTEIINGANVETDAAAYIYTSYGSLVNGKAVCEGYAKGFKAVMDRLEIPCVCVSGYSVTPGKATYELHMWNYVQVDGIWYAVDVTWNDDGIASEKWLLMGENKFSVRHLEDGIVSSANIDFKYPAIKPYDYGDDTDDNGMNITGVYRDSVEGSGTVLTLTVDYEGKGAGKLQEEGKYLAMRTGDSHDGAIKWGAWMNCIASMEILEGIVEYDDEHTYVNINPYMRYVQFALLDYEPDTGWNGLPDPPYLMYTESKLTEEHFLSDVSAPYQHGGYIEYYPAPGAVTFNPAHAGDLPVGKTYDITVSYNTDLKLIKGKNPEDVTIEFYTSSGNANVHEYAKVSNVVWSPDSPKTISFKFTPSKMYEHNLVTYYFYPTNLVGGIGEKAPDPFTYCFKGKSVVCSKVFNDGRLYMSVFGEPKMLDTSDLSMNNFIDENGNRYAESQRSQLMLVANKPSAEQEQKMDEVLKSETQIKNDDVVTSATYEIDLQICGVVQKVPQGSYMQVSFGFPEGFSPDDSGTTFKVYHYTRDSEDNIIGVEEIPVIVTQYGLIAQVKSFSPFTIVQLKNTSAEVTNGTNAKNVYATVVGNGGTVSTQKEGGAIGSGIDAVTGDSITYDIKAANGYKLAQVFLNGVAIDSSRIVDGKLTLTKDELADSNMLEVTFVTSEAAQGYEDRGIEISHVMVSADASDLQVSAPIDDNPVANPTNVGLIVGCVVAAVVVAAGVAVLVVFIVKKKRKA